MVMVMPRDSVSPRKLYTPTPVEKIEDLSDWLTRAEAADLMGVSEQAILTWTQEGKLTPRTRPSSHRTGPPVVMVYSPRELKIIGRNRHSRKNPFKTMDPGERCALAFEVFDEGGALRDVVLRVRVTLAEAEKLHAAWLDAGGAELVINRAARDELEVLVGSFTSIGEMIGLVRTVAIHAAGIVNPPTDAETTIEIDDTAEVFAGSSDAEIEHAIVRALDKAGAP